MRKDMTKESSWPDRESPKLLFLDCDTLTKTGPLPAEFAREECINFLRSKDAFSYHIRSQARNSSGDGDQDEDARAAEEAKKAAREQKDTEYLNALGNDALFLLQRYCKGGAVRHLTDFCAEHDASEKELAHSVLLTSAKFPEEEAAKLTVLLKSRLARVREVVFMADRGELVSRVNDLLKCQKKPPRYAMVSREDLSGDFWGRFVLFDEKRRVPNQNSPVCAGDVRILNLVFYELEYTFGWSFWWEEPYRQEASPFNKVIFLDVDGVLNNDEYRYNDPRIDPAFVANLKYIVSLTDADIILSSSWKGGYYYYARDGFVKCSDATAELCAALKAEGLQISGVTPACNLSGREARPAEIRNWLSRFPHVESFVILDDDTFWHWGYLKRNVVTTITIKPDPEYSNRVRYHDGLTREMAVKAIAILNDDPVKVFRRER
ncbi:MAG: HAD domain-containing protein [Succinimonas sp.]|nr:HAD domain-containing protein [Succinimonas sp.]